MPDTTTAAEPDRSHRSPNPPRWMWVLIMLLVSIIVAVVAGLLTYAIDHSVPRAILAGGGAFTAVFILLIAIAHYAGGNRP